MPWNSAEAPNMSGVNTEPTTVRKSSGELPQRSADPNRYTQQAWDELIAIQINRVLLAAEKNSENKK